MVASLYGCLLGGDSKNSAPNNDAKVILGAWYSNLDTADNQLSEDIFNNNGTITHTYYNYSSDGSGNWSIEDSTVEVVEFYEIVNGMIHTVDTSVSKNQGDTTVQESYAKYEIKADTMTLYPFGNLLEGSSNSIQGVWRTRSLVSGDSSATDYYDTLDFRSNGILYEYQSGVIYDSLMYTPLNDSTLEFRQANGDPLGTVFGIDLSKAEYKIQNGKLALWFLGVKEILHRGKPVF